MGVVELNGEVQAFLDQPRFAVLATINPDGSVQQSVMWYERVGSEILMNTTRTRRKAQNLLRDARAGLCVEDGYTYVALSGRILRTVDDQAIARADIFRLGVRYDGQKEAERQLREVWSQQQRLTLYMSIERVATEGLA